MGDLGGFLFGMAGFIFVVMVALWVLYSLFSLIRSKRRSTASDTLDERYARGEISEQRYRKMMANLNR